MKNNKFNSGMDSDSDPSKLPPYEPVYCGNAKPRIIINLTDEQVQLFEHHASIVNNDNHFLPYWFKRIEGNKFELMPLGDLPPEMSAEISEMRVQIKRDILINELNEFSPKNVDEFFKKYPNI